MASFDFYFENFFELHVENEIAVRKYNYQKELYEKEMSKKGVINDNNYNKLIELIAKWMGNNVSYWDLNDFASKEEDVWKALQRIYLYNKDCEYPYLPKNINEFNDTNITQAYQNCLTQVSSVNEDKLCKLKEKMIEINNEYVEYAKELMNINLKMYHKILKKSQEKFKKEYEHKMEI